MTTIIFDLNRTLFDPEAGALMPGAFEVLEECSRRGHALYLISRFEKSREGMVKDLGIEHFFSEIHFVDDKEKDIKKIIEGAEGEVYLVGDYLYDEIRFGNRYGAHTIWFKSGAFKNVLPENPEDIPRHTIESLIEVLTIIP